MLLVTTIVWGGSFAIAKHLVEAGIDPMAQVAWRFGLASVLFVLLFARRVARRVTRRVARPGGRGMRDGAVLGALLYVGFGLQTAGLGVTTSSRSGFITALYVIFTPLLQVAVLRRAPSPNVVAAIVLVLLGLWGLTAPGGGIDGLIEPWRDGGFNLGDLMTLGCAIVFAVYIVVLDRVAAGSDIVMLTAVQLAVVAALAIAHVAVASALDALAGSVTMPDDAVSWSGILYLALFSSVLATYWQTRYQHETTPSRAAVIYTLESVFAAAIAAIFLGESLTLLSLVGGALIVGGLLVVARE